MHSKQYIFRDLSYRKYDILELICFFVIVTPVNARTNPRFDMRDKDGIIFDPIAPRAGERLIAKCTLVGLTDTDKRSVRNKIRKLYHLKYFLCLLGQLGTTSFEMIINDSF